MEPDTKTTGDNKKAGNKKVAEKLLNDEVHVDTYIAVFIVFAFALVLDYVYEKLFHGS